MSEKLFDYLNDADYKFFNEIYNFENKISIHCNLEYLNNHYSHINDFVYHQNNQMLGSKVFYFLFSLLFISS